MDDARDGLLQVENLSVSIGSAGHAIQILDDVSFSVQSGEARGFVGESGSGKSVTLRAILGLLPSTMHVSGGRISFDGETIVSADSGRRERERLRRLRGTGISMIFQEPSVALNPVLPVGEQIIDAVRRRDGLSRKAARSQALDIMDQVGIPDPAAKIKAYAFELSGGLRQRVMIAAAVAGRPRLILCDEPTTALDVTVQKQILDLFRRLRSELDAAVLYVTHDLAVVAQLCDSLTVMYGGRVMESRSDLQRALSHPRHPYTRALLQSTPDIDQINRRLRTIPGRAPLPEERSVGCPFAPRCDRETDECTAHAVPDLDPRPNAALFCLHPYEADSLEQPAIVPALDGEAR